MVLEKITHIVFDHDGTLVDTTKISRTLYPGIKELLMELNQRGIPMYVWTARDKKSTQEILSKQGVLSFFIDICGGDSAARKPSAEGLEYLLSGVNAQNVIVIGDSIGDIIGAKSFGATAVAVLWDKKDERAEAAFIQAGAYKTFFSPQELKLFLEKSI